ncbi:hypothetical protein M885DRAFT_612850 [Pelagophyceae sp. CCMP2097]|nr:hypothetical protein M885DRAFT_612850 [Pelagophyceae sp. CCMP2097]
MSVAVIIAHRRARERRAAEATARQTAIRLRRQRGLSSGAHHPVGPGLRSHGDRGVDQELALAARSALRAASRDAGEAQEAEMLFVDEVPSAHAAVGECSFPTAETLYAATAQTVEGVPCDAPPYAPPAYVTNVYAPPAYAPGAYAPPAAPRRRGLDLLMEASGETNLGQVEARRTDAPEDISQYDPQQPHKCCVCS